MNSIINYLISDYAIIIYEIIGIVVTVIYGNKYSKRIKKIRLEQYRNKEEQMFIKLDKAIENSKRREL